MAQDADDVGLVSKERRTFCTLGAIVNYIISLDFLAIFLSGIVIIGTLGTLQGDLHHLPTPNTSNTSASNVSSHQCILFCTCEDDSDPCIIVPNGSRVCEGTMALFGLLGVLALVFIISLIVKAVLRLDLNWTVLVEVPVLAFALLLEFAGSLMLSFGVDITCKNVKTYNEKAFGFSGCNGTFPGADFTLSRAYVAMKTAWFVFMFFAIAMVVFTVRMVIYLRRKKKARIQNTIEKECFVGSSTAGDETPQPI